jgi:hypothetical protein
MSLPYAKEISIVLRGEATHKRHFKCSDRRYYNRYFKSADRQGFLNQITYTVFVNDIFWRRTRDLSYDFYHK